MQVTLQVVGGVLYAVAEHFALTVLYRQYILNWVRSVHYSIASNPAPNSLNEGTTQCLRFNSIPRICTCVSAGGKESRTWPHQARNSCTVFVARMFLQQKKYRRSVSSCHHCTIYVVCTQGMYNPSDVWSTWLACLPHT